MLGFADPQSHMYQQWHSCQGLLRHRVKKWRANVQKRKQSRGASTLVIPHLWDCVQLRVTFCVWMSGEECPETTWEEYYYNVKKPTFSGGKTERQWGMFRLEREHGWVGGEAHSSNPISAGQAQTMVLDKLCGSAERTIDPIHEKHFKGTAGTNGLIYEVSILSLRS